MEAKAFQFLPLFMKVLLFAYNWVQTGFVRDRLWYTVRIFILI